MGVAPSIPRSIISAMESSVEHATMWIAHIDVAEASPAFAFAQEYFAAASVVARENLQQFIAEYFSPGAGWWHAYSAANSSPPHPIGCVGLHSIALPNSSAGDRCAEIKRMYVRRQHRGQGIAQLLLRTAEKFARQSGYAWIYLDTTDEMKAAAKLYQRHGYQICDRYNQNPQATIFMRKNISVAGRG
jgi:GNAT superfamily N-acetyltransferase